MLGLVTIDRPIRGELSLVYLRVMRELAAEHGVPVKAVPDTPSLAIPFELQDIAKKMMAYANGSRYDLNEDEEHLLRSRYIHLSAHWKPTSGLLISKPAPNVRLVYNNKPQQGYPE
ncbi:hypothetical protein [Stutzerimonas kunmingensis]|uniref:hypothetical protein n=1 Tax=Stutzerimonas kunmingensis TaxID=1211807 RepID=UPI003AB492E3